MSETKPVAANCVNIEIDGVSLEAPRGSMIIEAADKAGITIPRFCYHRKLSIAANCRMCLVDVEKAPKPLPACATPVMDGMKVYTQSKRALSSQQNVMEFLLINHPLDCPICDQGGECELQDVSMGFGRSISRFTERKRVVKDEDLGSLVSTDMTRCIHCTRCVRFLEEIAGTNELGGIGRGDRTMISTFIGRSIDSELSGNIIDLCPVGALTNKPYRFTARAWELRSRASIAPHDAVGSNLHYHLRRGRIMRAVPRDNEAVNESWLADRDRWGFHGLYAEDRATQAMIRGEDGHWQSASWDEAIDHAAGLLRSVPGEEVGFLLSGRATNEEQFLAARLAQGLGSPHVDHRLRQLDFGPGVAGARPCFERPIAELRSSDAIFVVGGNLRHDLPILGHQVRQAARAGAAVSVLNSVAHDLNFSLAGEQIVRPSAMPTALAAVAAAAGVAVNGAAASAEAESVVRSLQQAERATILFGQGATRHARAGELRSLARALAQATGAAFCEVPDGANGVGAGLAGALPGEGGLAIDGMLAQPRGVYFLHDFEPGSDTAYGNRLRSVLKRARVVHCGAYVTPEILDLADVILPVSPAPECEGSFTNLDGTIQLFDGAGTPPGEARAGWKVLRVLGNALGFDGFGFTRAAQVREALAAEVVVEAQDEGVSLPAAITAPRSSLELVAEVPLYGGDGLVRRSEPLQSTVHGESASVTLHPSDAQRLGIAAGERCVLRVGEESVELPARLSDRIAQGGVRVPLGLVSVDAGTADVVLEHADG